MGYFLKKWLFLELLSLCGCDMLTLCMSQAHVCAWVWYANVVCVFVCVCVCVCVSYLQAGQMDVFDYTDVSRQHWLLQ